MTTTAILERVDVDRITAEAKQVRFGVTVLTFVAFMLVWAGRIVGYLWLVPVWCFVAVRRGWRDVHPQKVSDGRSGPR